MSFVGRDAELRELERHCELVRSGRPRLLVVEGPAGIGKTALVDAVLEQAAGFQVVRASGDESEVELAYGVVDQLTRMAGATAPEVLAQAKLSPSRDDHVNVGLGVLQLLGRLQDDGPVLVVVDDAHWADLASLRALLFATRRLVADAVLVVMVVRDEDAERLPDGLRRLADGNLGARLRLGPLAAGALSALAAERGVALSPRMARRLREHTAGSPLPRPGAAGRAAVRRVARRRAPAARAAHVRRPGRPPARGLPARRRGGSSRRPRCCRATGRSPRSPRWARCPIRSPRSRTRWPWTCCG